MFGVHLEAIATLCFPPRTNARGVLLVSQLIVSFLDLWLHDICRMLYHHLQTSMQYELLVQEVDI